ncbi:MAG: DUF4347 domain-containing protein, partial [Elainellaceae cyanobacterium]
MTTSLDTTQSALVVIDERLTDANALLQGVKPGAAVLRLTASDGIASITRAIQQMNGLRELHLVSHGSPGCLYLGNTELSLNTLPLWASQISQWFDAASTSPSLLLYGCNVAAGDAGEEFVSKLHQVTGAAIAASTTRTGHASLGGNWFLDVTVGHSAGTPQPQLAFIPAAMQAYAGVMVTLEFDTIPVGLNGANRFNAQAGDVFRFSNVVEGAAANEVDALVTVVALNNGAQIQNFDNNGDNAPAFRPRIQAAGTNGGEATVDFQIAFVQPGTIVPAAVEEFFVTLSDIDGISSQQEFANLSGFQSFTVLGDTDPVTGSLIVAGPSPRVAGATRFVGASRDLDEFLDPEKTQINTQTAVSVRYVNTNV